MKITLIRSSLHIFIALICAVQCYITRVSELQHMTYISSNAHTPQNNNCLHCPRQQICSLVCFRSAVTYDDVKVKNMAVWTVLKTRTLDFVTNNPWGCWTLLVRVTVWVAYFSLSLTKHNWPFSPCTMKNHSHCVLKPFTTSCTFCLKKADSRAA